MVNQSDFVSGVYEKYPEKLLEDSNSIEGTLCATLLKNMILFDDSRLEYCDFITKIGRLLFYVVNDLRSKGFCVFDEITMETNLDARFLSLVKEQIGEYKNLQHMMDVVSEQNWDGYLDNLRKRNSILGLYRKNFNILQSMQVKGPDGSYKDVIPFEIFKKMDSTSVIQFYEGTLAELSVQLQSSKIIESGYVGFSDNWLQSLKEKRETGVSFGDAGLDEKGNVIFTFPFMDRQISGLLPGTLSCWGAYSGCGKAVPNYTIIPTPNGYRTVGSIKEGDFIFGSDGNPTKVLKINPQQEKKNIWKIKFEDDSVAECCEDHLWEVFDVSKKSNPCRVDSTKNIYNTISNCKNKFNVSKNSNKLRFCIRVNEPVNYEKKKFEIDPYVIGSLAVIGSIKDNELIISNIHDNEIPSKIANRFNLSRYKNIFGSKSVICDLDDIDDNIVEFLSNDLFVNRKIPDEYLLGSVEQRIDLLNGILDACGDLKYSDGTINVAIENETTAVFVRKLCKSLGILCFFGKNDEILLKTSNEMKQELFTTFFKNQKISEYINSNNNNSFNGLLGIKDIEQTDVKTDMTCFTVDNDNHLWLMNDFIVTHNTTYMVSVIMALISKGIKVSVVTNEMKIKQYNTMFLEFVLSRHFGCDKITKSKINNGEWTQEEYEKYIKPAQELWDKKYKKMICIDTLEDADAKTTCQIFKKRILSDGCGAFLIDTFKLSISDNSVKDSSWIDIVKDTRDLSALASKFNVIGLMTVQLAPATMNRSYLDSSCLSNCKGMKEVMSNLILFRKVVDDELDPNSKYYLHPFRSKQGPDGKWYEEPFEIDRTQTWRVAFVDKTRTGADSTDMGGIAYLWKYRGDICKFSETCKCRPTRSLLPGTI